MLAEERALHEKYGAEYTNWAATTPKFLPRLSFWRPPLESFALGRVLRREHTALLTLVTGLTCLEIAGDWSITSHISIDLEWVSLFTTTVLAYGLLFILKQRRYAED